MIQITHVGIPAENIIPYAVAINPKFISSWSFQYPNLVCIYMSNAIQYICDIDQWVKNLPTILEKYDAC